MRRVLFGLILVLAVVLSAFAGSVATQYLGRPAYAASAPVAAPAQSVPAAQAVAIDSSVIANLEGTLQAIYQAVSPSVVSIEVTEGTSASSASGFRGQPFQSQPQQASGSGFVWDKQGHIVTNNHVVDGASSIRVTFTDGTSVPAKLVGREPNSDLAVIQVDVRADKLVPVTVADSTQVKVGQLAVAIGNPFGLDNSMTVGFVSALGRSLPVSNSSSSQTSYTIPDIIQTDAPINPGNSGGILLNSRGEVIGVPSAIESPAGTSAGVGFAIPSATVQRVVPVLIDKGSYTQPWLGISGTTLTSELAQAMNLNADQHGALVVEVTAGGPAEKAGLKASSSTATVNGQQVPVGGDVIISLDGQAITSFDALVTYLSRSAPGKQVSLTVLRDGKQQTVNVTLGERPAQQAAVTSATPAPGQQMPRQRQQQPQSGTAWLGVRTLTVTADVAQAMNVPSDTKGALIVDVVAGSPAEKAGLRASTKDATIGGQAVKVGGDIITSWNGKPIGSAQELSAAALAAKVGDKVTLTVLRDGGTVNVDVTLQARGN